MNLAKTALAGLLAVPAVVGIPAVANAESAPGCSGTVQIGSTAHIYSGGQTFASVKQFKGCGKNWSYVYVWEGYRNSHSSWNACAAVGDNNTRTLEGTQCRTKAKEVWSLGTNTLAHCTQAIGWIPNGASAKTSERC
ncbi:MULTISPECIES: hypothetical protein [Actinomadura]|uniref:DUF2690 domain-containing protein n=2 Tax=Actinomadura geliboluensis TaxID=882440 RepID=A0A5S4H7T3_9ACTN|nr:hypothetical protein [Actinomadura geliboluensis]TMR41303.1 hypothetical protein ETD96_06425 [Actinomadura geliboluensis]